MGENVDISVIIPVYNAESCLRAAIDSVLMQGVSLEVIAVDDASCDTTPLILREYESALSNFRVITFRSNRGVGAARGAALGLAQGRYLAFCDADDTVPHGAYRAMLRAARDRDVVIGAYLNIDESGVTTGSFKPPRRGERTLFRSLFSVCCLWNKLIRREFVVENRLQFDTGLTVGEDVVFLGNLFNCSPTYATTDRPVYSHLLRRGSLVHTYTVASFMRHIECRKRLLEICKSREAEHFVSVELSPYLRNFLFDMNEGDLPRAFELYKEYILEISASESDQLFMTVTGAPREGFEKLTAREYIKILSTSPPRERVLAEYFSGAIGLRWLYKFFTAWLKYKLTK